MSMAACNDQDFDFDPVDRSMDKNLTGTIQDTVDTDQDCFAIYLEAHTP